MDSQDINNLKRKLKFSYVANGVLVLACIGFFFYGLVNNVVAMKDKEWAITSSIKLKECERESEKLMASVLLSQREAEHQRALALEAMDKAKGNKK